MKKDTSRAEKASPNTKKGASLKARAKKKPPTRAPKNGGAERSRLDGTGRLDSAYAVDLHARSVASSEDHTVDRAFLRRTKTLRAPLAVELGREAVMTMTSAEDQSADLQDNVLELNEEIGGPFVPTTSKEEFARGVDRSNPRGATQEPFPTS